MVAFIVLLGIIFGGVKLLAVANNISDSEAMDKYSGKLFVIGIIILYSKDKKYNYIKC